MRKDKNDRQLLWFAPEVRHALDNFEPVLALESTVITHGLPYPRNLEIAQELEQTARDNGATPATIVLIDGIIHIGLLPDDLERLGVYSLQAQTDAYSLKKLARRDLPLAVANQWSGGTTVSATLQLAHLAGIQVFATGGIGGVHRAWQDSLDISADLPALADYPIIIVTAGCKAILDIPATLELLETLSVPVYGWQTDRCPAFYTKDSAYPIDRVDEVDTIINAWQANLALGQSAEHPAAASATVVMNPIPEQFSLPSEVIEPYILQAVKAAEKQGIKGKATTPFLLQKLSEITQGRAVQTNLELLKNNVRLGSQIARRICENTK
jgi:pseudouridylate synthase